MMLTPALAQHGSGHEAQAETTDDQTPEWLSVAQHELGPPREPQQTPTKQQAAHDQNTMDASGSLPMSPHSLERTRTPSWLSAAQQKLELGNKDAGNTPFRYGVHIDYSSPFTDRPERDVCER